MMIYKKTHGSNRNLTIRPRPPLRHCPICGIAMQANRTRDDIAHFDLFECLSCQTTIRVSKTTPDGKPFG